MHQKTVRDSTMHICTYIRKYELEVRIETFKKMWNKTFNNKYRYIETSLAWLMVFKPLNLPTWYVFNLHQIAATKII